MTSTERQMIARRNQAAAARRLAARTGAIVEQPRLVYAVEASCPECSTTSLPCGSMPDHGEQVYNCPRCRVTFYTMGPDRLASRV